MLRFDKRNVDLKEFFQDCWGISFPRWFSRFINRKGDDEVFAEVLSERTPFRMEEPASVLVLSPKLYSKL